uniref:NADH-ubiquinone oxidoreductase chain 2 n=1 Tax=Botrylloides violaceus TaxID=581057 RepID=A0A024GX29_BOTVI|nr:NADH dehydrogenase subunit 2 [Botrylloides violaceus]CCO25697.1 NADH dehydrogenase subunit 2 [Botrylloides violaceus]
MFGGKKNFLVVFYGLGVLILFVLGMNMFNIFYMWMMMEFVFFVVILFLIKYSKGEMNLGGVIFYLFVQALGGVLFLSSMLVEVFYFGNYYYLGSSVCLGCLYLSIMGVMLKVGMFPFYLQVYQIMSFINFEQILLFMLYPKIIPVILVYSMFSQLDLGGGALMFSFLVMAISAFQGIKSSDMRELLAWSGVGQLGWIFVSALGAFSSFVFFFWLYFFMLMGLCFLIGEGGSKLFFDFFSVRGSLQNRYTGLFLVFFMSGLAPFLMFYVKLFLIYSLECFSMGLIMGVLLGVLGMSLFYVRILQILMCSGSVFFFQSSISKGSALKGYAKFLFFFFFCFGGALFLV